MALPHEQRWEAVAALLERAYRMALVLQERTAAVDDTGGFERSALAGEVVALLDDARAAMVAAGPPC